MKILNLNKIKLKLIFINKEKKKLLKENNFRSYNPKIFILDIILGILVAGFNIMLFIMNIYFLFIKKNILLKKFNDLKDIDQYIFILLTKSYNQIGKYLNNKYYNSSNLIISKENNEKKVIRLHSACMNSIEEFRRTLLYYLKDKLLFNLIQKIQII